MRRSAVWSRDRQRRSKPRAIRPIFNSANYQVTERQGRSTLRPRLGTYIFDRAESGREIGRSTYSISRQVEAASIGKLGEMLSDILFQRDGHQNRVDPEIRGDQRCNPSRPVHP